MFHLGLTGISGIMTGVLLVLLSPREARLQGILPLVVLLVGIGLLAFAILLYRKCRRRWDHYEPRAEDFARRFRSGANPIGEPPLRPAFVVGVIEDVRTPKPLHERIITDVLNQRVTDVIRKLLKSCGEKKTLLGTTVIRLAESDSRERLAPAWVIDRVWDDGRSTTEWIYVGRVGERLRIAVGAYTAGSLAWRLPSRIQRIAFCSVPFLTLAGGFIVIGPCCAVYSSVYLGKCILPELAAQQKEASEWADPLHVFRIKAEPADDRAAKERVRDALSDLEPLASS